MCVCVCCVFVYIFYIIICWNDFVWFGFYKNEIKIYEMNIIKTDKSKYFLPNILIIRLVRTSKKSLFSHKEGASRNLVSTSNREVDKIQLYDGDVGMYGADVGR